MKKSKKGFWLFIAPALIAFTIVQIIPTFMGIGYIPSQTGTESAKRNILSD